MVDAEAEQAIYSALLCFTFVPSFFLLGMKLSLVTTAVSG